MALVIAAIAKAGEARSLAIATVLAQWERIRLDSAVNRFYRLLRNSRFDERLFVTSWSRILSHNGKRRLLVAVDWTEWHSDLRMLVGAVVTGKRAIPLFSQAVRKPIRLRSQNSKENAFMRILSHCLKSAGVEAIMLCDRGFRRVSWIKLMQKLKQRFVVRLQSDVTVTYQGQKMVLKNVPLPRGKAMSLGVVPLRDRNPITVRVIGYWARGAKEPWWLATSEMSSPREVVKLYDRRMTVEEQFRDLKGRRFGAKLSWTQFKDPDKLARFMMLLSVALLIWIVTGTQAADDDASLRMKCKRKGPRQSDVTIGLRICKFGSATPRLTARQVARLLKPPARRILGRDGIGGAK
jgi:hypothetical protein